MDTYHSYVRPEIEFDSSLFVAEQECLIVQVTGDPAAALYIYSVYSPFVDIVNQYMTTGWAIVPPISQKEIASLLKDSSLASRNFTLPSSPSNFSTAVSISSSDNTRSI